MKHLSILELQNINGGCKTCKAAGAACKRAWNSVKETASHVADAVSGFWNGVFS